LPSITPAYLYTFVAVIAVSNLLLVSFVAYANTIQLSSEVKQLKDLVDYIAAKSIELLTLTTATNATVEVYLQMPTGIGDRQYWLQLSNDSANAWVSGGFGTMPLESTEFKVYLPRKASAGGYYIGGYGAAHLTCSFEAGVSHLELGI